MRLGLFLIRTKLKENEDLLRDASVLVKISNDDLFGCRLPVQTKRILTNEVIDLFWERNVEELVKQFRSLKGFAKKNNSKSSKIAEEMEFRTGNTGTCSDFLEVLEARKSNELQVLLLCLKLRNRIEEEAKELNVKVLRECERKRIPKEGEKGETEFSSYFAKFSYEEVIERKVLDLDL